MTDCDEFDRDGDDVVTPEVTMPTETAESLMDIYPTATSLTEAVRMAVQNDISRQREKVTPASITNSVVDAIEQSGGVWKTSETLRVGEVGSLSVDRADSVNVGATDESDE